MSKVLSPDFFARSVLEVAPELLGKYLVMESGKKKSAFKIVEVEAYEGEEDLASHASRSKTPRNAVMYGKPGYWYVYLIYGMYWMLNIVCEEEDRPAAILIRGVEELIGPGRLTKALGITNEFNAKPASIKTGLWIEDLGEKVLLKDIQKTPRIGVDYAGPIWAKKDYRFVLRG